MSERDTTQLRQARHGASFWDGVEREIEALDCADFALFLGADALAIEPRPEFGRALANRLQSVCRARWSN
ncbi:MAG: hypothetical protein ACHQ6T_00620 [Myxococcota bacterium]